MTDHNSPQGIRAEAIESLLIDKGLLSADAVDAVITTYTERVGPMNGAKLVAKAWSDPAFKADLLADATKVVSHGCLSPILKHIPILCIKLCKLPSAGLNVQALGKQRKVANLHLDMPSLHNFLPLLFLKLHCK